MAPLDEGVNLPASDVPHSLKEAHCASVVELHATISYSDAPQLLHPAHTRSVVDVGAALSYSSASHTLSAAHSVSDVPLHADVYVPMLTAARRAGDARAARALLAQRRDGESTTFRWRRAQKNAVLELERQTDAWLAEKEGVAV